MRCTLHIICNIYIYNIMCIYNDNNKHNHSNINMGIKTNLFIYGPTVFVEPSD